MEQQTYISVSALNHYAFCPRRCFYIYVEQLFFDNVHTLLGQHHHQKVHQEASEFIGDTQHLYGMTLFSRKYGLSGQGDKVEITPHAVIPIEYKNGRKKRWRNDRIQLCAQALCLEEMLGREVEYGFLFYHQSRRREEVRLTKKLRTQTLETIEKVRQLLEHPKRPNNPFHKRCEGCSFFSMCLPKETQILLESENTKHKEEA